MTKIIKNSDVDNLNRQAVGIIIQAVAEKLKQQGSVVLGIPGGRSVLGIFSILAQTAELPWSKIQIFMVDDRLRPVTDPVSNFGQAKMAFIDSLVAQGRLPEANLHPFIFQPDLADFGRSNYEAELKRYGGKYDIILLGVGEDGHTAALFPGHHSIQDGAEFYLTFNDSPKPPAGRLTASKKLLLRADYAVALFLGESKKSAYVNFLNSDLSVSVCPVKLINQIKNSYLLTNLN